MRYSLLIIFMTLMSFANGGETRASTRQDSIAYIQVQGIILDQRTHSPVIFANIHLSGTNMGTVSNSDGEFILRIPASEKAPSVIISSIGYKNLILHQKDLIGSRLTLKLEPVSIPLTEVTIINRDPLELLVEALDKIRDNYSQQSLMLTSFYRESIRKRKKYLAVSEAVLEGYKAPYSGIFDNDRVRILKARNSNELKRMDTIAVKLQGGPHTMFQLDFVKNPAELLERQILPYYSYEINGLVQIDDRMAYVISFEQLPNIDVPLYTGRYYVGVDDLAFISAEFWISEDRIDKASEYMVRHKPPNVQIDIKKAHYLVKYHCTDNNWGLSYVRSEISMVIRREKKYFRSNYTTTAEMVVTDVDSLDITKYKFSESAGTRDILSDQVNSFEDPDFWGDYNIIHPEESIQTAVERMGRKLKRKSEEKYQ